MEGHYFRRLQCACCGKILTVPVSCGNRFCPVCNRSRLIRVRRRLDWLVAHCPSLPHHQFTFITFTIKSMDDLPLMIRKLVKSFGKLRSTKLWKDRVAGGAYVIELKHSSAGWHAHIHLVCQNRWIDWKDLLKAWIKCSGARGVFMKRIPANAVTAYVTKYLSKPDVPDDILITISQALHKTRLVSPFGSWFNLNKLYPKPKQPCSECGKSCWSVYDEGTGFYPRPFWLNAAAIASLGSG